MDYVLFFVSFRVSEIVKGNQQTHHNCYVASTFPFRLATENYSLSVDREMSFSFTRELTQVCLSHSSVQFDKLFNHSFTEIAKICIKPIQHTDIM